MKKILVVLFVLFFGGSSAVFGQNAYQLVKLSSRAFFKPVPMGRIKGHIRAPLSSFSLAQNLSLLKNPLFLSAYTQNRVVSTKRGQVSIPEIHIDLTFPTPILRSPSSLWGSYHYLRVLTSLSRHPGAVQPKYAQEWKQIFSVNKYNGVHHIVNKSTLQAIYHEMKRQAAAQGVPWTIHLDEMQRNAPGSLHPFHGRPEFSPLFHNIDRQLEMYRQGGVRAIINDYFDALAYFHKKYPKQAPPVSPIVRKNTLLEAKLWCDTFHLKWK